MLVLVLLFCIGIVEAEPEIHYMKLNGTEGVVYSPGYPFWFYGGDHGKTQYWNITVPSGFVVMVRIIRIDIYCHVGSLYYKDGTVNYCTISSTLFTSTSRNTFLYMKCNAKQGCGFFVAKFEAHKISNPVISLPSGQFYYKGTAYKVHTTKLTWISAEQRCKSYQMELASLHNFDVNMLTLATKFALQAIGNIWIGLRRNQTSNGRFLWSDESQLRMTRWTHLFPKETINYNCTMMNYTGFWVNAPCEASGIFVCKKVVNNESPSCSYPFGIQNGSMDASHFTASSIKTNQNQAYFARLYGSSSWMPIADDQNIWLQISTLNSSILTNVTGIATQGAPNAGFVKSYILSFSQLEDDFVFYKDEYAAVKVFKGNEDFTNVLYNDIKPPIIGWRFRVHPKEYHLAGALRIEVYGCSLNDTEKQRAPIGLQSGAVLNWQINASTFTAGYNASNARLHLDSLFLKNAWHTSTLNIAQWLQVTLKGFYSIRAIATQGSVLANKWTRQYYLTYSKTNSTFRYYQNKKIFQGNSDANTVVTHTLSEEIICTSIRVNPIGWSTGAMALRIELYGSKLRTFLKDNHCEKDLPIESISSSRSGMINDLMDNSGIFQPCYDIVEVNQIFTIVFSSVVKVTGVSTRGFFDHSHTVSYRLKYVSVDGTGYITYTKSGVVKYFHGNADTTTIIRHDLPYPVYTKKLSFVPSCYIDQTSTTKFSAYGCIERIRESECSTMMGMGSKFIPISAMDTSAIGGNLEDVRLNSSNWYSTAWTPTFLTAASEKWLQVDFGIPSNVTAIGTLGSVGYWIVCYKVGYFMKKGDAIAWYTLPGERSPLSFKGNVRYNEMMKHYLEPTIFTRYIRIFIIASHDGRKHGLKIEFYGCGNSYPMSFHTRSDGCNVSLGLQDGAFYDTAYKASSERPVLELAGKYIGLSQKPFFWQAKSNDNKQWVEIKLKSSYNITGVITEGNSIKGQFVETFMLKYLLGEGEFRSHRNLDNHTTIFTGNTLTTPSVKNKIIPPIVADTIRLLPVTWKKRISLRMDLIGCELPNKPGDNCEGQIEVGKNNKTNIRVSTIARTYYYKHRARLLGSNYRKPYWSSAITDKKPWLEIDFGQVTKLSGVATQGGETFDGSAFVKSFTLGFANGSAEISNYVENVKPRVFFANNDSQTVVRNTFNRFVVAQRARLYPLSWNKTVALRMEYFGCKLEQIRWITQNHQAIRVGCFAFDQNSNERYLGDRINVPDSNTAFDYCSKKAASESWPSFAVSEYQKACRRGFPAKPSSNVPRSYKCRNWGGGSSDYVDFFSMIVHGNFSEWSIWSTCSQTCGNGTQYRSRVCNKPAPMNGGRQCVGSSKETRVCGVQACPWSSWGQCSTYCGLGYRNRTRFPDEVETQNCNNAECFTRKGWGSCYVQSQTESILHAKQLTDCMDPSTGKVCTSCIIERRRCNVTKTLVGWSSWTACSKSCGAGKQKRSKTFVFYVIEVKDGTSSIINQTANTEEKDCLIKHCPVNGGWTSWTETECTVTCASGTKRKSRTCTNPSPAHGGTQCQGQSVETLNCNTHHCPVNGGYTVWSSWTPCSFSCDGKGHQRRHRTCSNPPPQHGGICVGHVSEMQCCLSPKCIDGNFTSWSNWSQCSLPCGNGTQYRTRTCTNPPPLNGGQNCTGPYKQKQYCNTGRCIPVNGNFTEWSTWTPCSASCGGKGQRRRDRTCSNPPPQYGGICVGPVAEMKCCKTPACIDGNFTSWSNWSRCGLPCVRGNGTQYRTRTCTNPPPLNGGKNCTGPYNQTQYCQDEQCIAVDGNYSEWNTWSTCTLTCGGGTQQRMRTCTSPPPAHGGRNCTGADKESQTCNQQSCPTHLVNGGFTTWSVWSTCTLTCGGGAQHRRRTCTNPPPANNGANCTGPYSETQDCNTQHCPINGNWTEWSEWTYCSRPCGTGQEIKTRTCTNPPPQYGGDDCHGGNNRSRICNTNICPAAEVLVVARFTAERWSAELQQLNSAKSQALKEKILTNVRALYETGDRTVTGIIVYSFKSGSVVANFTIQYNMMNSIQFVKLQDSMQTNGALNTMPLTVLNVTSTKVPSSSPIITEARNSSSTSLFLTWSPIPTADLHGKSLSGYVIFYRENTSSYTGDRLKSVPPQETSTTIAGLKKFTVYLLRIAASTANGNGKPSDCVVVKTDEDVPSQSPANLKVTDQNSTSISLSWDPIDPSFYHGVFLGYNLTLINEKTGEKRTFIYNKDKLSSVLIGLNEFTKYRIKVCGMTRKGSGADSEIMVTTNEDKPNIPPPNTKLTDFIATSSINITWDSLLEDDINGILRGYKLKFKLLETSRNPRTDFSERTITIGDDKRSFSLDNLVSYSRYEIKLAAFTSVGEGPSVTRIGETCRCPKHMPTNYWPLKPYLKVTKQGIDGIFPHVIQDLITSVCDTCKNGYGETMVDFSQDGRNQPARKEGLIPMIESLDKGTGLSFPVNGNKDLRNVYGEHPFVFIVQSPGIVFLTTDDPTTTLADKLMEALMSCGPLVLFSFLIAYLAGVVMWVLDKRYDSFASSFTQGVPEGFWWAYITMTTVGYGDRSPQSVAARLFAILWTLYGIVVATLVTSSITTALTSEVVASEKTIYGSKIAAVSNSSEHRIGILLNGIFDDKKQYHNLQDVLGALRHREVDGALVDTYVAESESSLFQDSTIRVVKKIERPFGYGIALEGDVKRLEDDIRDYVMVNERKILNTIEENVETGTLKRYDDVSDKEQSVNIFDTTSQVYRECIMVLGSLLSIAVVCGLVWQVYYKWKLNSSNRKVASCSEVISKVQQKSLKRFVIDSREIVSHFCCRAERVLLEMKERHNKEKAVFLQRMKTQDKYVKNFKERIFKKKPQKELSFVELSESSSA